MFQIRLTKKIHCYNSNHIVFLFFIFTINNAIVEGENCSKCVQLINILGTSDAGVDVRLILGEEAGHAEIGDLGDPLIVEQNVAGLDVAVDDAVVGVFVKVEQAPGDAAYYVVPSLPIKPLSFVRLCVKIIRITIYHYIRHRNSLPHQLEYIYWG